MSNDKTGGPAFPCDAIFGRDDDGRPSEINSAGMTMRDYFAAKAPDYTEQWLDDYVRYRGFGGYAEARAAWNYEYADAMLDARKS